MVEFHVTGGRAVVASLLSLLSACPDARPAEPGEFARRAFQNGKIDLAEVEGLASIVQAETNAQLQHARLMASGALSRSCKCVKDLLLSALAQIEAMLDFSDVEEVAGFDIADTIPLINDAAVTLKAMNDGSGVSERLRDGMIVVIAGPPNVGKSTLLNQLAQRDVAIVSPFAGTTRDVLEVTVEIRGFPVVFLDTAGIRESRDPVESEGIARARERALKSDLVLWLTDDERTLLPSDREGLPTFAVRSKADLLSCKPDPDKIYVSARTGFGISELVSRIGDFAADYFQGYDRVLVGTERQRAATKEALSALDAILQSPHRELEILADDLRAAVSAIGRISGQIGAEEVLGEIFSRLCVGK